MHDKYGETGLMGEIEKPIDLMSSLINLSFFVMRKEAKQIRESLHKAIVEMAIFWGRRSGVFKREISGLIERNLPLIKLPKRIIDIV